MGVGELAAGIRQPVPDGLFIPALMVVGVCRGDRSDRTPNSGPERNASGRCRPPISRRARLAPTEGLVPGENAAPDRPGAAVLRICSPITHEFGRADVLVNRVNEDRRHLATEWR